MKKQQQKNQPETIDFAKLDKVTGGCSGDSYAPAPPPAFETPGGPK